MPARKAVSAAWTLVAEHPREAMLPLLVIQVPVAVITSGVLAVLLLTVFGDEEIDTTKGGQLLAVLLIGAPPGFFPPGPPAANGGLPLSDQSPGTAGSEP